MKFWRKLKRLRADEFRLKLEKECLGQGLAKPEIIEEMLGSIKLRINLATNSYIDLYFNEDTETLTSALVMDGSRVFGINGYPRRGQWHLHPTESVREHVRVKPMGIRTIVKEYVAVVRKLRIKKTER